MDSSIKQQKTKQQKPNWPLRIGIATAILALSGAAGAAHHQYNGNTGHQNGPKGPISIAAVEQRLNEAFDVADVDNSGELSAAELATVKSDKNRRAHKKHRRMRHHMASGGNPELREQRTSAMFDALDVDDSGQLSPEEFAQQRQARRELRQAHRFSKLDIDNSNSVSRDEFAYRLQRLQAADTDLDGQVTRQEMKAARAAHREKRSAANNSDNDA